ncbi:MAG: hypothetical protein V8S31_07825 [Lachnospiraceae bacterium]
MIPMSECDFGCKVLNNDEKKIEPTITALVQCFPDLNADELRQLIQNEPRSSTMCWKSVFRMTRSRAL